MSETLGEKLRQAREERGITLSEVADQTRISSLYLESIEHDDYRNLPGGIFNKGFVKSFAKYVGINEQEALADYSRLIAGTEDANEAELKVYRPEVLTDDRFGSSMMPTVIVAVVILAIMTGGILYLVSYLQKPTAPSANTATVSTPSPANDARTNSVLSTAPDMATLKVEFKATTVPVSLTATSDGKLSSNVVPAGSTTIFEPKDSLKLSYSRSLAQTVQLNINGKNIVLPSVPPNPKRNIIEFEINKGNIGQIWQSGAISTEASPANPVANANGSDNPGTPAMLGTPVPSGSTPLRPTPQIRPSVDSNKAPKQTPTPAKPANTTKPSTMVAKPTPKPQ